MATPEIKVIKLKVRRGTDAQRKTVVLDQGEIGYTTDTKRLYVGDGATTGGTPVDNKHVTQVTKYTSLSNTEVLVGDIVLVGNPPVAYILDSSDYTDIDNWLTYTIHPDNSYLQFTDDNNKSGYLTVKPKSIDLSVLSNNISSQSITIDNNELVVRYNSDYLDSDSNGLRIADSGVTETSIKNTSLGNGLTGGSGQVLSVRPDFETLDFNINGDLTVINTPLTAVRQDQLSAGLIVDPVTNLITTAVRGVDINTMTLVDGVVGLQPGIGGGSDVAALSGNWQTTYTTVCANSASWVGGSSGSSIVASYVNNALSIAKPTSSNVVVNVSGLQYTMVSGKTYYVKMFITHDGASVSGSNDHYYTLDYTPWSTTAGIEEGFWGMHWTEFTDNGTWNMEGADNTGIQKAYSSDATKHLCNFLGVQPYNGMAVMEGMITAPSTAAFEPTITLTGDGTGNSTVSFQGVIHEMP